MNIENDTFDAEEVIKEAEASDANPRRGNASALDAYFAKLGTCQRIDPQRQIELAAGFWVEVAACRDILDQFPGKVRFVTGVLQQILDGARLENFIQSGQALNRLEFFKSLKVKASWKGPCLKDWNISPNLLLNWCRELIRMHEALPQRPWLSRISQMNPEQVADLQRWLDAVRLVERETLLPINQSTHYINELKPRVQRAEGLFNTLVECNLTLVVAVARRYQNRGLPLDDLIQEGNLGLVRGLEKFQPATGCKVSTHVAWWIQNSITRALATQQNRILPMSNSEEAALEQTVASEEGATFDESQTLREAIKNLFRTLKPQERHVLRLRFGLASGFNGAVNEVASTLKVTRERVRQIEANALSKLRGSQAVQAQKSKFRPA